MSSTSVSTISQRTDRDTALTQRRRRKVIGWTGGATGALPRPRGGGSCTHALPPSRRNPRPSTSESRIVRDEVMPALRSHGRAASACRLLVDRRVRPVHRHQRLGDRGGDARQRRAGRAGSRPGRRCCSAAAAHGRRMGDRGAAPRPPLGDGRLRAGDLAQGAARSGRPLPSTSTGPRCFPRSRSSTGSAAPA